MSLLPTYIEDDEELEQQEENQTPKEYEIDFKTGQLTGNIVEGLEAIKTWIWLVLQTPRYRYYVYTWDYGNEFEDLIGQGYTEEYIEAETQRMTEDCLSVNENIQGIETATEAETTPIRTCGEENAIIGEDTPFTMAESAVTVQEDVTAAVTQLKICGTDYAREEG